jgi:hypothetical protein
MDDKENLFYRPGLQPDRDYHSEAIIPDEPLIVTETETETTPSGRVSQLIEDILEIKEVSKFLPSEIPIILEGPLDPLLEQIHVMFPNREAEELLDVPLTEIYDPEIEDPLPDILPILDFNDEYTYLDAELPNLLPQATDIKIEIVTSKSLADIVRDTYIHDTIDLKEDYLKKLQTIMQKYLQEMIMIMAETGIGKIEDLTKPYDGSAVSILNKNLQHLGDYVVRSQIVREQKIRLFKKTHNIDQTMMHMRAWHAAQKQRERYYAEEYGDSENYLNTQSNSLLRESRARYDKKYNHTLYDMYKYLNASVMIIDDTLNMSLKESQAKGTLLRNGVNIYVNQESVEMDKEEAAKTSAVKNQVTTTATPTLSGIKTTIPTGTVRSTRTSNVDLSKEAKEKASQALRDATNGIEKKAENALKEFGKRLFTK